MNSKYAYITKEGKVFIISDSITKPIDMLEFNNNLKNRDAVKRAFPGATESQINHYVHASLIEDNLTTLVICAGTNNLTKKNQTADQTAQEIIEIAKSCHQGGVRNIFVSGINMSA